jgi:flagellar basal-body rod protein FlgG
MLDSFYIAAAGMNAQQAQVDVISNNLANVNTTGFKKSTVDFEDLMYRELNRASGLLGSPDIGNPVGTGTAVASITKVFTQGEIKKTERPLDIAIEGQGFLELMLADGTLAYTRTGNLQIDREGMLVNSDGHLLNPSIRVPADSESLLIRPDGVVLAQVVGENEPLEVGRLQLANFTNPSGLTPAGDNLYVPSHQSGDVIYAEPGQDGIGLLAQGFLEGSNVNLVEELTNLILAQRGYEMNAKAIQAADDMLSIVNNMRR